MESWCLTEPRVTPTRGPGPIITKLGLRGVGPQPQTSQGPQQGCQCLGGLSGEASQQGDREATLSSETDLSGSPRSTCTVQWPLESHYLTLTRSEPVS